MAETYIGPTDINSDKRHAKAPHGGQKDTIQTGDQQHMTVVHPADLDEPVDRPQPQCYHTVELEIARSVRPSQ